jgi:uncharacterized membrane protein YhhN
MSDPNSQGPLSAFVSPFAEAHADYRKLPLNERNGVRASWGAFLIALCSYIAMTLGPHASRYPQEWKLAYAAVAGVGLLLFVIGMRGSRGCERDPLAAIFAVVLPVGGWIALTTWLPEWRTDFYVRGFFVAYAAANAVRFFLAIRGGGGNAQKIVHQQIAQNEIIWQGVKRR